MSLGESVAVAAPIYNLGLVLIALYLFIKLFNTPVRDRRVYLFPWKILFAGLLVFILEEIITILRFLEIVDIPRHINGFFELVIICSFIYMILLQREHVNMSR